MTREEAIYRLKNTAWLGTNKDREETEQAVDMAIEALKAEPIRCDECLYQRIGGNVTHYYWCDLWDREVDADNYCSWGERREP